MCKTRKPYPAFAKCAGRYDGVQALCRACKAAQYQARKEKHRAACRSWALRNPAAMLAYSAKWRDANRAYLRERDAKRAKERPEIYCAKSAKRRTINARATPAWANHARIAALYECAKHVSRITGVKYHVDHIVPLQSPLVCGLHVEHNLQLLPASDNVRKHNKKWPDMPNGPC